MIEVLISRVFHSRNLAHWNHWRTKSYAQHKALGHFYDDVIEALPPRTASTRWSVASGRLK